MRVLQGGKTWLSLFRRAAAALLLSLAAFASASAQDSAPVFTIVARSPDAEIHFHGITLRSLRADDRQNEVALDFAGPVDGAAFDALQKAMPDWIAMAYSGYDSAVIRGARPVTFLTRPEADGFSLKLIARDAPPARPQPAQLRGAIGEGDGAADRYVQLRPPGPSRARWRPALQHYEIARAERPDDATLRTGYDLASSRSPLIVRASGGWRANHDRSTIYEGHAGAAIPVDGPIAIVGRFDDRYAHAVSVRHLNGTFSSLDRNSASGALGLAYDYEDGSRATAEILYGKPAVGAALGVDIETPVSQWGAHGVYHETYDETAEAIADEAVRDRADITGGGRILDGLWASVTLKLARYGVHGDANLAHTAGFTAGLSYLFPAYDGVTLGASYVADAEYTLGAHKTPGPPAFIPLSIRTREVHDFSGSLSTRLLDDVWVDAFGGYAIDRYGKDGALYGGEVRWSLFPDFDIVVGGEHRQVAERQGETGPETSAHLALTYR